MVSSAVYDRTKEVSFETYAKSIDVRSIFFLDVLMTYYTRSAISRGNFILHSYLRRDRQTKLTKPELNNNSNTQ